MGDRKRLMAERQNAINRETAVAKLNDVPTSPRKMRYVADTIRGVEVNRALDLLKYSKKEASTKLAKLLKSAITNWESKNEADRKELDNGSVIVKSIMVGQGRTLKRIRTAPQGRAARVRKRSNHVTIILDKKAVKETAEKVNKTAAKKAAAKPVAKPAAKTTVKKPAVKKAAVKAEEK